MFKRPDRTIACIFLLGLVLRLSVSAVIDVIPDAGELQYNALAVKGGLGAEYAPLYPLFLRLVYRLFGAFNVHALYAIQGVAGACAVPLMFAAVSRIGGRRAGVWAAVISALYPDFILYGRGIVTESWSVLLVASMMAIASADTRAALRSCAQGVLVGIGVLLKPEYVFFLPGFLVTRRRTALMLLGGFFLVVAPLAVRNSVASGHVVPVYKAKAYNTSFDLYAYGSWRMIDFVYGNALLLYSWHPGETVEGPPELKTEILAIYYIRKFSYLVLLWLGFLGLARCVRRDHVGVVLPVLGAVILPILFTRVAEPRFRVFLEPLLIMYVSLLFGGGCRATPPAGASSEQVAS
jgi:4-amino-4-deoxy-L-arabinose transferase-like glycosyltransferase